MDVILDDYENPSHKGFHNHQGCERQFQTYDIPSIAGDCMHGFMQDAEYVPQVVRVNGDTDLTVHSTFDPVNGSFENAPSSRLTGISDLPMSLQLPPINKNQVENLQESQDQRQQEYQQYQKVFTNLEIVNHPHYSSRILPDSGSVQNIIPYYSSQIQYVSNNYPNRTVDASNCYDVPMIGAHQSGYQNQVNETIDRRFQDQATISQRYNMQMNARQEQTVIPPNHRGSRKATRPRQSSLKNTNNPPCAVCSDASSGVHYGAIACEGCKSFFRRSVKNNLVYKCKCPPEHKEPINRVNRNRCPSCRYTMCLEAGMRKSGTRGSRAAAKNLQSAARKIGNIICNNQSNMQIGMSRIRSFSMNESPPAIS